MVGEEMIRVYGEVLISSLGTGRGAHNLLEANKDSRSVVCTTNDYINKIST